MCKFGQVCKNPLCQHRHIESKDNYQIESTKEEVRINEASGTQTNEIDEAYEKIQLLEENKTASEKKLKLYSTTIRKMANERKNIQDFAPDRSAAGRNLAGCLFLVTVPIVILFLTLLQCRLFHNNNNNNNNEVALSRDGQAFRM